MKKLLKIIFAAILFLIWLLMDAFGQTWELNAVLWDSMHSNHVNQCNPTCAQQNNGGVGFLLVYNDDDKWFNMGIGQIRGKNSYDDDLRVDIIQLADAAAEFGPVRFGVAAWKMWIYGYKRNGKDIVEDVPPWPAFHVSVNPLYFLTKNFSIRYWDIEFIGVQVTFTTVNFRWRF